jgi:exosortase family protein XrtM
MAQHEDKRGSREFRFLLFFLVMYIVFHTLYFMVPNSFLLDSVYHTGIVSVSANIINFFAPAESASAVGNKLVSSKASLEIVRGCDGAGATFLLMAAILAFSATWKQKLVGLIGSLALMYALNQTRVIGLYFVVAYERNWFNLLHTYFAPTLIVVICCIFFLWWIKWSSRLEIVSDNSPVA